MEKFASSANTNGGVESVTKGHSDCTAHIRSIHEILSICSRKYSIYPENPQFHNLIVNPLFIRQWTQYKPLNRSIQVLLRWFQRRCIIYEEKLFRMSRWTVIETLASEKKGRYPPLRSPRVTTTDREREVDNLSRT